MTSSSGCAPIGWEGTYARWIAASTIISLNPTLSPGRPLCGVEGLKK
jgi:hypothetical protein